MNEFNKHIFRQGRLWVGKFNDQHVSSPSIFMAVGWVNKHRSYHDMVPLDLWIAQQLHWAQSPREITQSTGVAA